MSRAFVTLLYGDTGCGKTYVAMTFPEPILFIDTENRAENKRLVHFKDKKIKIEEPMELKTEVNKSMDDIFDEVGSINNLTNSLSQYIKAINEGKIKGGTLVIDNVTDLWSWTQSWMFDKLSKLTTKSGQQRANNDLMTVTSQLDWKVANNKHDGIVRVLRSLIKNEIYIVFTAKQKSLPDYAMSNPSNKEKVRAQKEIPFMSDVIFNLIRQNGEYIAVCEKLGEQPLPQTTIRNLNFDKIISLNPLGEINE